MACTDLGHSGISFKNYRSHSASSLALFKALNSDSIVERAMQVCLEDFQDTVAPPRVKMYPLVDFDSSKSAIQFALMYPSSTCEYIQYFKAYPLVLDTQPLIVIMQSNDHH